MKFSRLLIAAVVVAQSFNVNAAAIATVDVVAKWDTLTLVDNVTLTSSMAPTSLNFPPEMGGGSLSAAADGNIFINTQFYSDQFEDFSDNDAPMSVSYSGFEVETSASYVPLDNESRASTTITNTESFKYAGATSKRGVAFEATQTGKTRLTIDATASGSGSVTGGTGSVNGGFGIRAVILDADTYTDTYVSEFLSNGGDEDAADLAAFTAALIKDTGDPVFRTFDYLSGCVSGATCTPEFDFDGTLPKTGFDVVAGRDYFIEISMEAYVTTYPFSPTTAVPVPAAAWLFASGLIGLVGMARRKA